MVQASPQEILTVLVSLGAVEVEGKVRVVSQELVRAVTAALLENIIAQQWSIAAVSEQECSTALQASSVCTDLVVLQSALRLLSVPAGSAGSAGSALTWETVPVLPQPATTWSLDPSRLKQAAAHVVFRERTQDAASASGSESGPGPVQLGVAEFVQEWTLRTPGFSVQEVSDADLALLRGIAVRVVGAKDKTTEDTLHYLPVEDMEQSAKVGSVHLSGVVYTIRIYLF